MAEPVLFNGDLAMKSVQSDFFMEYVDGLEISPFMGDRYQPVFVEDSLGKGHGDNHYFSFMDALNPEVYQTGMEVAIGNSESQTARSDQTTLQQVRKSAKLEGTSIMAQRTPMDFFNALRPQLLDCIQQITRNNVIDTAAYAVGGSSPVQSRTIVGAAESNYNATLATALANIDASGDKMTTSIIRRAKLKAQLAYTGAAAYNSRKIRPVKIEMNNGMKSEFYIMWLDPRAANDLRLDTTWSALATQGKFEANAPSYVLSGNFMGMFENVLVYEMPSLTRIGYATAGDGSSAVAHNLFLGAQAFGMVYGLQSFFSDEYSDFKNVYELCHTEIRGQTMLKFTDNNGASVENGLVHVFTTAANA